MLADAGLHIRRPGAGVHDDDSVDHPLSSGVNSWSHISAVASEFEKAETLEKALASNARSPDV